MSGNAPTSKTLPLDDRSSWRDQCQAGCKIEIPTAVIVPLPTLGPDRQVIASCGGLPCRELLEKGFERRPEIECICEEKTAAILAFKLSIIY